MKYHDSHLLAVLLFLAANAGVRAEWKVWTLTETRHVLRSESPAPGTAAKLSAARNEWVSFQILVRADAPVNGIRVEPGDLAGPSGMVWRGSEASPPPGSPTAIA